MPYTKFDFNITSCRASANGGCFGLKKIMSSLTSINRPLLKMYDCSGKEVGVICVINSISVQQQQMSMHEDVTLNFGLFAFENEIADILRTALSCNFTFEIGELNTNQGYKFDIGIMSVMNFKNGDYEIYGRYAIIDEECAVSAYAEKNPSPLPPYGTPPWPVATPNPVHVVPPPPTRSVTLPVSNACNNWGWDPYQAPKKEEKPNPRYCRHEAVNVGFNKIKLVCKKCDKDLPDDYKSGDYITNDDWETI